jgi:hypothetical protein
MEAPMCTLNVNSNLAENKVCIIEYEGAHIYSTRKDQSIWSVLPDSPRFPQIPPGRVYLCLVLCIILVLSAVRLWCASAHPHCTPVYMYACNLVLCACMPVHLDSTTRIPQIPLDLYQWPLIKSMGNLEESGQTTAVYNRSTPVKELMYWYDCTPVHLNRTARSSQILLDSPRFLHILSMTGLHVCTLVLCTGTVRLHARTLGFYQILQIPEIPPDPPRPLSVRWLYVCHLNFTPLRL